MFPLLVPHLRPIAGIQHPADLKKLGSVTPGCYDVLYHFEECLVLKKPGTQREGELESAERVVVDIWRGANLVLRRDFAVADAKLCGSAGRDD